MAEQDDTDRATGVLRQAGDQPGGAEGDRNSSAVIGGAGAEIPGIEMSTDENDLVRTPCTLDLADDIPGRCVLLNRRCEQKPDPYRTKRRQPLELLSVRNGQRGRRNPPRAFLVIEGTGVGQTMAVGAKRAQKISDGAAFCGLGGTATPDPVSGAIAAAVLRSYHALGHDRDLAVERTRSSRQQIVVGPE